MSEEENQSAGEGRSAAPCSLPDWFEVEDKKTGNEPTTPLDDFIHENEPAGLDDSIRFRRGLIKVLKANVRNHRGREI